MMTHSGPETSHIQKERSRLSRIQHTARRVSHHVPILTASIKEASLSVEILATISPSTVPRYMDSPLSASQAMIGRPTVSLTTVQTPTTSHPTIVPQPSRHTALNRSPVSPTMANSPAIDIQTASHMVVKPLMTTRTMTVMLPTTSRSTLNLAVSKSPFPQ